MALAAEGGEQGGRLGARVSLQPCQADQAGDWGRTEGLQEGRPRVWGWELLSRQPGTAVAVAGGPGYACSLAPGPETFSVPPFHHPGLEGSISSLISQMKDAF